MRACDNVEPHVLRRLRRALAAVLLGAAGAAQAALLALYPFEGNGNDISGNNRHASIVNATPAAEGYEGQAYSFNGSQYLRLPVDVRTNVAPRVTFGAWVWMEQLTALQTVLSTDSGNWGRTLNIESGQGHWPSFSAFGGPTGGVLSSDVLHYRRWVFQAVRYDHETGLVVLSVDGMNFVWGPHFPGTGNPHMDVGRNPDYGNYLQGGSKIDNVFVFNEFLSDQQIETIRTRGVAGVQAVAAGADGSVDLQATLTMPANVRTNDLFEAQVRVRNLGAISAAMNATVHATLPAASTVELAAVPDGCWLFGRELYCGVGSVAPGASKLLKLPLLARKAGPLPLSVNLSTQSFETDPANDIASAQSTVANAAAASGLSVAVPIANASFESPALTDGTWTFDDGGGWAVPGWSNPIDYGVYNPSTSQYTNGEAVDGLMHLWSNRDSPAITQTLNSVLTRGLKYTLRVAVIRPLDSSYGGYRIELWAGGQMLASQQNVVQPAVGGYAEAKLNFTLRGGHPAVGHPLEIRLMRGALGGIQVAFDRVRLNVTAAPPAN